MQGSGSCVLTLESLPTTHIKLVTYAKGCFAKEITKSIKHPEEKQAHTASLPMRKILL